MSEGAGRHDGAGHKPRQVRADAQRNLDALLEAAKAAFAEAGVDAPVRDIAGRAGVGVATVYRHFPHRADLIAAVFRREMDACVDAASVLAATHEPVEALALWLQRFAGFIATKRGLAAALYSGDPAYEALPGYWETRLVPAIGKLLAAAIETGQIRDVITADGLLDAVARLSVPAAGEAPGNADNMVALLVDGLRFEAPAGKPAR
tara:strand:- start:249 stop:866 length:618 start_codon:yes stop_codon:yes gene_type:complete